MSKGSVLILGARSDIGKAIAHAFAAEGHPLQLAARRADSLAPDQTDLALRYGVSVTLHELDALDLEAHEAFLDSLPSLPEITVSAIGLLGDQTESAAHAAQASTVLRSNFEAPAQMLGAIANRLEAQGAAKARGTLVGISSVAGDRGRATNYVYGSAKAGFTAFLSGLRNRLVKEGVHVVTVLPGFVATKMTEEMDLPEKLTAQPEEVAEAVHRAVATGKNVIYVRRIWRLIMVIIRSIPEGVFKRMKL